MFALTSLVSLIGSGLYDFLEIAVGESTNYDLLKVSAEAEITFACGITATTLPDLAAADSEIVKIAFAATVEYLAVSSHGGYDPEQVPMIRAKYNNSMEKLKSISIPDEDDPDGSAGVGQIGVSIW
jgi:hypothetical protein